MLNLEVRHLKLVTAVAEEGTVTRAANRLHLTQSALSHQLQGIESRLGAPLFLRMNKKMILTQAGERLLNSARGMLQELEQIEEDIQQIAANRLGIMRISTECYTCYHWLPAVLRDFHQAFPRVEVRIVADATRRPIEALLSGRLDIALTTTQVRNRNLLFKPLFRDELVVILPRDHPLASRPYLVARDFAEEHLIVYSVPKEELSVFQKVLIPAGVAPKQVSQLELTEAIVEMVKAGLGVSVMARWAVAPQIKAGLLRAVPMTRKGFHRQWRAAMIKTTMTSPYLIEFVDLLVETSMPALVGAGR